MALKEEKIEKAPEKVETEREKRWKAHVDNYKAANPVKYARKLANGEFNKIPDTFPKKF